MPDERREQGRNFVLGVLNGAVFRVTMVFVDPEIVLTWFLAQMRASNLLIGLVSPIRMGSSFLLHILVSGYLQRRPHELPFCRIVIVLRSASLLGLATVLLVISAGLYGLALVLSLAIVEPRETVVRTELLKTAS